MKLTLEEEEFWKDFLYSTEEWGEDRDSEPAFPSCLTFFRNNGFNFIHPSISTHLLNNYFLNFNFLSIKKIKKINNSPLNNFKNIKDIS